MSSPYVLILHNQPILPPDHPDAASEYEILETGDSVVATLTKAGYRVHRVGVGPDLRKFLETVNSDPPDVIFNIFEGLATIGQTEATMAGLLEWLDIPYTGCPAETLSLANDKYRSKLLLQGAGLPTPAFFSVDQTPCPPCSLRWPVIVKPASQDASVGIEQASVVTSQKRLNFRVARVQREYGPPVLVEEFIPGREFHVNVIDDPADDTGRVTQRVLPLAEIAFLQKDNSNYWPIYSYKAKWKTRSREYRDTPLLSPVELAPDLMAQLSDMSLRAYRLFGCRDFARLDVRMDENNQFYILEVNPNPFINSRAMTNGLEAIGRTHEDFIIGLVEAALRRKGQSAYAQLLAPAKAELKAEVSTVDNEPQD
ncbi:MAG: hypothetical protein JNM56_39885 [Planctomycetia bacterium]|nr:hypothetical protein [Planctomycetia bacterium]